MKKIVNETAEKGRGKKAFKCPVCGDALKEIVLCWGSYAMKQHFSENHPAAPYAMTISDYKGGTYGVYSDEHFTRYEVLSGDRPTHWPTKTTKKNHVSYYN